METMVTRKRHTVTLYVQGDVVIVVMSL